MACFSLPLPLSVAPQCWHRVHQVYLCPIVTPIGYVTFGPYFPATVDFRFHWLTSQARYVRVRVDRRAMHASGDSPRRSSAKRHVLRACLPLMAPFRSMLLTTRSGPCSLAPKAHEVPVYLVAFLHSYVPLSRHRLRSRFRARLMPGRRPQIPPDWKGDIPR